ncbi:MAG: MarR family winged helix-turn-helix transcriptional regulator [Candidatus Wukongarchaeota archaeon]|nr:MarR family transcriptional regulator [Candidatus Wukongarchaeota archaeon]
MPSMKSASKINQESVGRLASCIYRYGLIHIGNELKPYNIGSGQFNFLMALYHKDGINQETLAQSLKLDKATTARAITKLIKEGYVTRQKDDLDLRAYKIFLTKKAKKMGPIIKKILSRWTKTLLSGFTEDERKLFLDFLKRTVQNATFVK